MNKILVSGCVPDITYMFNNKKLYPRLPNHYISLRGILRVPQNGGWVPGPMNHYHYSASLQYKCQGFSFTFYTGVAWSEVRVYPLFLKGPKRYHSGHIICILVKVS